MERQLLEFVSETDPRDRSHVLPLTCSRDRPTCTRFEQGTGMRLGNTHAAQI
ncbi:hypothetical protein K474DRAFT_1092620 [Panus rudis PR-1116 ss-1]|nr:hypothetical protein K474DRAFT_1092620 [Panus rudis PR-1116 ss-1]